MSESPWKTWDECVEIICDYFQGEYTEDQLPGFKKGARSMLEGISEFIDYRLDELLEYFKKMYEDEDEDE